MKQVIKTVDWDNIYKIKLSNYEDAFLKHEVVKLLILKNILLKFKKNKNHHLVYTEFDLNGKKCDVYYENTLTGEIICYEIQSNISDSWLSETQKFYFKNNLDWVLIDLNKLSDNLQELNKQIKELII